MDTLCRDGPLWNTSLTWGPNNTWPQFTECFQNTVLVWIPSTWLWVASPFYFIHLLSKENSSTKCFTWKYITKQILALILLILCIVEIVIEASNLSTSPEEKHLVHDALLGPLIEGLTLILMFVCTELTRRKGVISTGVLFLYWTKRTLLQIIPFYSKMILQDYHEYPLKVTLFFASCCLTSGQVILHSFADHQLLCDKETLKRVCPLVRASFLSRITFWWMNRLVWTGYKNPLSVDDVFPLHPNIKSSTVVSRFNNTWQKELQTLRARTIFTKTKQQQSDCISAHEAECTIPLHDQSRPRDFYSDEKQRRISLLKVLFKSFGFELFLSQLWKIPSTVFNIGNVILLKLLIDFAEDYSMMSWKGYVMVAGFLLNISVKTFVYQQLCYKTMIVALRVKTALISAVYSKSLTINNKVRTQFTLGEIVNLMSVDVERIFSFVYFFWGLWASPLEVIIALSLLYGTVGPSMLAGLAVLILLMPLNAIITRKIHKLEDKQMKYKDERVKLITEILNGIKILKLHAWEMSFRDKVKFIRDKELRILMKSCFLNAFMIFSWNTAPFVVGLATFATYVFVSEEHVISPQTAFVSLALFNILRSVMNITPTMINNLIKANVSVKRLDKFLNSSNLAENVKVRGSSESSGGQNSILIEDGVFTWDSGIENSLTSINLKIPQGSLIAVVGQVGSGKSSLLSAILGEMEKISGNIAVVGSTAYVSQQAWIQNATLRNNILFGEKFDCRRYWKIVEACALSHDLDLLPANDATEIGEKGINLSGGQKQRLSLARAIYFDSDIYLMDDPLSAVDSHVGRHIFDKVISDSGLLKGKTRVLVTHGVHWLPEVDFIVVMSGGTISEIGSYEELMEHDGAFAQFLRTYLNSADDNDDENEEFKRKTLQKLSSLQSDFSSDQTTTKVVDLVLHSLTRKSDSKTGSINTSRAQSKAGLNGNMLSGDAGELPTSVTPITQHVATMDCGFRPSFSRETNPTLLPEPKEIENLSFGEYEIFKRSISDCSSGFDSISSKLNRHELSMEKITSHTGSRESSVFHDPTEDKLIEEETLETGAVKASVLKAYAKSMGIVVTILIFFVFGTYNVIAMYSSIWLAKWTSDVDLQNLTLLLGNSPERIHKNQYYVGIYGVLGGLQVTLIVLFSVTIIKGRINASTCLHQKMLTNVLRCPMEFFDRTPVGRVVNRFAKDIDDIDKEIPWRFESWLECVYWCIGAVIVISYNTPMYLAVIFPLGCLYFLAQRFYINTSRQLRRLQSNTRSLIISLFSETISGAVTIRAFGVQKEFSRESELRVDTNHKIQLAANSSTRWLAVRLELLGAVVVVAAGIFAVAGRETLNGAIVGLSISYAIQFTEYFNWYVRMTSELETSIVSVERILEYTKRPTEAPLVTEVRPPPSWPSEGKVEFMSYSTRYREGLDLILKDITVSVKPGEKVGIVGRTGAGKTSLSLSLFRMIEPAGGHIQVDGLDVSKIGLHDLRTNLTILPQEPVLFSGSLKMNLDPHDEHTDSAIWLALEQAHLKSFIDSLPTKLEYECGEGGQSLSVGQRQLVCLARSLLKKSKVLVLDEATAAVDMETDDLIQQTIRREFADCTVLTIAHRLNTVMDYDRILVIDRGAVKEFDSPVSLLSRTDSLFYQMAKDAGIVSDTT
ncbi:hypothetical protein ACJMK2_028455 [Sinanodonta woodiana]|uniref:ABC-type glutathione-S-conjugate transporter n=1 Tax=Sinanodonta woodiana TaxID=1069815 RepID=A0ABD3XAS2_SINWO